GLFIGTNQYSFTTGGYVNDLLTILPTAPLTTCGSLTGTTWTNFTNSDGTSGFTLTPVTDYDSFGATAEYVMNTLYPSGSTMTIWRVVNPLASTPTFQRFTVASGADSGPPGAPQPGPSTRIATHDVRATANAYTRYNQVGYSH